MTARRHRAVIGSACSARRTRRCSPARPSSPTTSSCPGALHLALVRSPYAHARISRHRRQPRPAHARRRRRLHRRRPAGDRGPRRCRAPGRSRADMKNPPHYPVAHRQGALRRRRASPSCSPTSNAEARDAVEAIDVDYEPLAGGDRPRGRARPIACSSTRTSAPTRRYTWALEIEPTEGAVEQAFAAAAYTVKERYVQQRLIPMAMEPRAVAAVPAAVRRRHHALLGHADPAHPQDHGRPSRSASPSTRCGSSPRRSAAASARSSTSTPRSCSALAWPASTACRCAGSEERTENALATIQGRGQIQDIELAADADGKLTAVRVRLLGRHGRLPPARHAGHPAARRLPLRRRVRPAAGLLVHLHVGVHDDDADRRLPRRRAGPRPPTPSSGRWTPWPPRSASTRSSCAGATSSQTEHSRTPRGPGSSTTRATTTGAADEGHELVDYDGVRAEQATRRAAGATKHLGIGISSYFEMCGLAPSRVLASLNYGAGGWERGHGAGAADQQGAGRHRAPRPHGQGHETSWSMIVADKLGVSAPTTSRCCTPTPPSPRSASTPTARGRSPSAASPSTWRCDKVIDKARQIAAHQLEAAEDDLEFADGTFTRDGLAGQGDAAGGDRLRGLHRPQPARRHGAQPRGAPSPTTRPTSRGRSAPTSASSRSTTRPARSTC